MNSLAPRKLKKALEQASKKKTMFVFPQSDTEDLLGSPSSQAWASLILNSSQNEVILTKYENK